MIFITVFFISLCLKHQINDLPKSSVFNFMIFYDKLVVN